jgi:hypothetical protein
MLPTKLLSIERALDCISVFGAKYSADEPTPGITTTGVTSSEIASFAYEVENADSEQTIITIERKMLNILFIKTTLSLIHINNITNRGY